MRKLLQERYGAGPLHLMAALAMTAIVGYGIIRIFGSPDPIGVLIWLGAAVLLHDALAFPLYTVLSRIAFGRASASDNPKVVAGMNHLKAAIFFSAILFLVFFPSILQKSERFAGNSGLSQSGFLERWLLLSAGIFIASALIYALRVRAGRLRSA